MVMCGPGGEGESAPARAVSIREPMAGERPSLAWVPGAPREMATVRAGGGLYLGLEGAGRTDVSRAGWNDAVLWAADGGFSVLSADGPVLSTAADVQLGFASSCQLSRDVESAQGRMRVQVAENRGGCWMPGVKNPSYGAASVFRLRPFNFQSSPDHVWRSRR